MRRPPLHLVLASAHDVGREHRIMEALQDTAVSVPPLVGMEPDAEVTGAPFSVMEFVDGLVPRDEAGGDWASPTALRLRVTAASSHRGRGGIQFGIQGDLAPEA